MGSHAPPPHARMMAAQPTIAWTPGGSGWQASMNLVPGTSSQVSAGKLTSCFSCAVSPGSSPQLDPPAPLEEELEVAAAAIDAELVDAACDDDDDEDDPLDPPEPPVPEV